MRALLLLMSTVFSLSAIAQSECSKCDGNILTKIVESESIPGQDDVDMFFCTFDVQCLNNVEFTEYGNEVLFFAMLHYPKLCLTSLANHSELQRDIILKELSRPINDGINIKKTIRSVRRIHGFKSTKSSVLKSLRKALPQKR